MRTWVASVVLAVSLTMVVAGGLALVVAAAGQHPPPPDVAASSAARSRSVVVNGAMRARPGAPSRRRPADGGRASPVSDLVSGPVLKSSAPVRLTVPRIGVRTGLVPLGLERGGALEVPESGRVAGWYTKAPSPGSLGPAVVAGHVTWQSAPAVFFRLADLRRGDRVQVRRRDGSTAVFAVRRVMRVSKARFPTEEIYGPTDHAALRLITCGGRFDESLGSFDDNVVVFAALTAVRRP